MKITHTLATLATLAIALIAAPLRPAHAGEVYGSIGLPGVMLGYAQPLGPQLGVRADLATLGNRSRDGTEEGIAYSGTLKTQRIGLFADWFPLGGSFRLSGGLTVNDYRLDMAATGAGGTLTIGNTTYTTTADDRFDVRIKFPSTTPYLGIGWGHHNASTGLRFSADLGAMIGKAKVSGTVSGPQAQNVSQADIDAELAELRDGVGRVKFIPQLSVGIGYSF